MAYVPKPESPENDPALKRQCLYSSNFRKGKAIAFLTEALIVCRRVAFRGGHWKEKFV